MPATPKQRERVEGIIYYIDDFLDKRFALTRQITPSMQAVEAYVRWHQVETLRQTLEGTKLFGPDRVLVADILCSNDENKKRDLFHPQHQSSILNEIVPVGDDPTEEHRPSQHLQIKDVRSYYKALEPSLERIVMLLETWIWWDLRDASDLYRFESGVDLLQILRTRRIDERLEKYYRREMTVMGDEEISRRGILKFEILRLKDIADSYELRRQEEDACQAVVVYEGADDPTQMDALCRQLVKRLTSIEKIQVGGDAVDAAVQEYYATQIGVRPSEVTADEIVAYETEQAALDRARIAEAASAGGGSGSLQNYKLVKLDDMRRRLDEQYKALDLHVREDEGAAAVPEED